MPFIRGCERPRGWTRSSSLPALRQRADRRYRRPGPQILPLLDPNNDFGRQSFVGGQLFRQMGADMNDYARAEPGIVFQMIGDLHTRRPSFIPLRKPASDPREPDRAPRRAGDTQGGRRARQLSPLLLAAVL